MDWSGNASPAATVAVTTGGTPPPAPVLDFAYPNEGSTSSVTVNTTKTLSWSETLASGATVDTRTLTKYYAAGSSAAACAKVTSWTTSTAYAPTGKTFAFTVGTKGRCYKFVLKVTDSYGKATSRTSGYIWGY